MTLPPRIDPRVPRFTQGIVGALALVAFLADVPALVPALALLLGVSAFLGPAWNPLNALWKSAVVPALRLNPPARLKDASPVRFAQTVGFACLLAATVALHAVPAAAAALVGWGLVLAVAALALLAAVTDVCVGCEIHARLARFSAAGRDERAGWPGIDATPDPGRFTLTLILLGVILVVAVTRARFKRAPYAPPVAALDPADVPGGLTAPLTALVFTSPLCGACKETPGIVRAAAPEVPVVTVNVRERPGLARALTLVETPTLILLDERGRIRYARAGNPEAAELWTYVREAWDSLHAEGALPRTPVPGVDPCPVEGIVK
jgi:hypothetical protein